MLARRKFWLPGTILAGTAGSICGITLSYVLGRVLGLAVLHRYGRYVGLSRHSPDRGHRWFVRYGKWSVVVGYFVPGFRHLVAISAGATLLELKFLPFACIGCSAPAGSTFVTIGYFAGPQVHKLGPVLHEYLTEIAIGSMTPVALLYSVAALPVGRESKTER